MEKILDLIGRDKILSPEQLGVRDDTRPFLLTLSKKGLARETRYDTSRAAPVSQSAVRLATKVSIIVALDR